MMLRNNESNMWDANLPVEHQDFLRVRSNGRDFIRLGHSGMAESGEGWIGVSN